MENLTLLISIGRSLSFSIKIQGEEPTADSSGDFLKTPLPSGVLDIGTTRTLLVEKKRDSKNPIKKTTIKVDRTSTSSIGLLEDKATVLVFSRVFTSIFSTRTGSFQGHNIKCSEGGKNLQEKTSQRIFVGAVHLAQPVRAGGPTNRGALGSLPGMSTTRRTERAAN